MKKCAAWILAIVMFVSVCPLALAAENSEAVTYGGVTKAYLTLSDCNMRTGKGTSYSVVATLQKGLTVWSSDISGTWYRVTYGGDSGYIKESILCEKTKCYYTTASKLNLRAEIGTSAQIIGTLDNNTFVQVNNYSSDGTWAKVRVREGLYDECIGWVSAAYLGKYDGI